MTQDPLDQINRKLDSLIDVLSRLAPPPLPESDLGAADCFVWNAETGRLDPVVRVNRVDIALIKSVDRVLTSLSTIRAASPLAFRPSTQLGARDGKSSLVGRACDDQCRARQDEAPPGWWRSIARDLRSPCLMTIAGARRSGSSCSRRSFLRCRRHLTAAEGMRKAASRDGLITSSSCDVQPPAPLAARHDRERAVDCDQPWKPEEKVCRG